MIAKCDAMRLDVCMFDDDDRGRRTSARDVLRASSDSRAQHSTAGNKTTMDLFIVCVLVARI